MTATVKQLAYIRSTLAESIARYYQSVIANLDRTPWSHVGSDEKIRASQVRLEQRRFRQADPRSRARCRFAPASAPRRRSVLVRSSDIHAAGRGRLGVRRCDCRAAR